MRTTIAATGLTIAFHLLAAALSVAADDGSDDGRKNLRATYFVATDGSDANPGTQDQPFRTIQKAVGLVKPGDTVTVRAGRYAGFQAKNLNGAAGTPITFRAYPGEHVTLDRHRTPPSQPGVIYLGGVASYLTFDGFEITSSDPELDQLRKLNLKDANDLAAYVAWRGKRENALKVSFGLGVRMESDPKRSHHLMFQNLEVHHLFGLGFSGGIDFGQFLDNHVYDLGRPASGYGWYVSGDRNVWRGNRVHDNIFGLHLRPSLSNATIENNRIYDNGGTYYHGSSRRVSTGGAGIWISSDRESTENIVRNNVIFNNRPGYGGLALHPLSNTKVLHNTFYGNSAGMSLKGTKAVTVQNNIVYANHKAVADAGADTVLSHNLGLSGAGKVTDGDPLFVDAAAGDFHLKAGSPAIDAGTTQKEVPADFDGIARPQGRVSDLGAYEYKADAK